MNAKQRAFVEHYLQCWNASEAARRAGYSEKTARQTGSRLLTYADIQEAIEERKQELLMSSDEVLLRLAEQARADYSDYLTRWGEVDMDRLIADGKAHLIKGIKHTLHGMNVEFYDAQAALQLVGKSHKLFTEKVEHDIHGSVEITADDMVAARESAREFEESLLQEPGPDVENEDVDEPA